MGPSRGGLEECPLHGDRTTGCIQGSEGFGNPQAPHQDGGLTWELPESGFIFMNASDNARAMQVYYTRNPKPETRNPKL